MRKNLASNIASSLYNTQRQTRPGLGMATRHWLRRGLLFAPDGAQVRRDFGKSQPSIYHVSHLQHRRYHAALEPACKLKYFDRVQTAHKCGRLGSAQFYFSFFEDGNEDTHDGSSRRRSSKSLQIFARFDIARDRWR